MSYQLCCIFINHIVLHKFCQIFNVARTQIFNALFIDIWQWNMMFYIFKFNFTNNVIMLFTMACCLLLFPYPPSILCLTFWNMLVKKFPQSVMSEEIVCRNILSLALLSRSTYCVFFGIGKLHIQPVIDFHDCFNMFPECH